MKEKQIEQYLVKVMKSIGGRCVKVPPMHSKGFPDRICLFPQGKTVYVELKAPDKEPTQLQWNWINWLREHKFQAYVIDSRPRVDAFVDIMMKDVVKGATHGQ